MRGQTKLAPGVAWDTGQRGRQRSGWVVGRTGLLILGAVALLLTAACTMTEDDAGITGVDSATRPPAAGRAAASPVAGQGSPQAAGPSTPAAIDAPRVVRTMVAGTPVTFRSEHAEVGPVVWTTRVDPATKAPLERVNSFPADAQAIVATVPLARVETGTILAASWTYNGTPIEGLGGSVTAATAARDVWVAFDLTRQVAEPWPAGTYAILVTVDGRPAQASEVTIEEGDAGAS